MPRRPRSWAIPLVVVALLLVLGACGSGGGGSTGGARSPKTVDVTFEGQSVDPTNAQVQLSVGQPLVLHITADAAGEIHVHSSPEQQVEYAAGTTDKTITITQPGVVDVESHTLDKLILQLEVH